MNDTFPDNPRPSDSPPPETADSVLGASADRDFSADRAANTDLAETPQFGVVDVIEAFTAMRHEWRGQTLESRELAESMHTLAANLGQLETKLLDRVGKAADDDTAHDLARVIIEIDIHLSRALEVTRKYEANLVRQRKDQLAAIRASYDNLNFVARWLCRPFWQVTARILERDTADQPASPTVEGLALLVTRLRRMMQDHEIQRFDTVGLPFDAEQMHAVDSVETASHASGHVVEQLAPGYVWRGQLVRFAEVRVAR